MLLLLLLLPSRAHAVLLLSFSARPARGGGPSCLWKSRHAHTGQIATANQYHIEKCSARSVPSGIERPRRAVHACRPLCTSGLFWSGVPAGSTPDQNSPEVRTGRQACTGATAAHVSWHRNGRQPATRSARQASCSLHLGAVPPEPRRAIRASRSGEDSSCHTEPQEARLPLNEAQAERARTTNRQSGWAGPRRTRPKRLRLRASAIPNDLFKTLFQARGKPRSSTPLAAEKAAVAPRGDGGAQVQLRAAHLLSRRCRLTDML
eukprot:COSAG06_NODE_1918_length_8067_cov_10.737952_10_plen_263_part_00